MQNAHWLVNTASWLVIGGFISIVVGLLAGRFIKVGSGNSNNEK